METVTLPKGRYVIAHSSDVPWLSIDRQRELYANEHNGVKFLAAMSCYGGYICIIPASLCTDYTQGFELVVANTSFTLYIDDEARLCCAIDGKERILEYPPHTEL